MSIHGSINEQTMNLMLEDHDGLCNTFSRSSVSSGICTPIVQAFCFYRMNLHLDWFILTHREIIDSFWVFGDVSIDTEL